MMIPFTLEVIIIYYAATSANMETNLS